MTVTAPSRQRLLVALATATRFGAGVSMGTALAVFVERGGGSPLAVSLLFTAYYGGLMLFAPVWGAVADVTGRRRGVLVLTGALSTVALAPLFVADGPITLLGVRGLYAVFAAGFAPVMLAIVSDAGGAARRGRALGFFNSARATGFTGGQLVAGALLGLLAPTWLYGIVAALSLVATVSVAFVDDETGPDAGVTASSGSPPTASSASPPNATSSSPSTPPAGTPTAAAILREVQSRLLPARADREHFHDSGLGWLYVALALRNMTVMGVMSLMPVYLTVSVGAPELLMGVVLAINPASQMLFMVAFGRVADARGRRPLVVLGMAGGAAFAVLAGLAVLADPLAARIAILCVAALVIGASFSAMTTGALAFIGDVAPDGRESELMGLRSTAKGIGAVVGAPVFGLLATVAGYSAAFLVGSSLSVFAAVLAWRRLTEPAGSPASPRSADD